MALTSFGVVYLFEDAYRPDEEPTEASGSAWRSDTGVHPVLSYVFAITGDKRGQGRHLVRQIQTRHWALAGVFATATVMSVVLGRARGSRGEGGGITTGRR
jgi:hypothetical protein